MFIIKWGVYNEIIWDVYKSDMLVFIRKLSTIMKQKGVVKLE